MSFPSIKVTLKSGSMNLNSNLTSTDRSSKFVKPSFTLPRSKGKHKSKREEAQSQETEIVIITLLRVVENMAKNTLNNITHFIANRLTHKKEIRLIKTMKTSTESL